MLRDVLPLALIAALAGCEPPPCGEDSSPYAFHVALYYRGGVPDLDVVVSAASSEFSLPNLDPPGTAGYLVRLDVEWGEDEPPGSIGTFRAYGRGSVLVQSVLRSPLVSDAQLTSKSDEDGCPATQHATESLGSF